MPDAARIQSGAPPWREAAIDDDAARAVGKLECQRARAGPIRAGIDNHKRVFRREATESRMGRERNGLTRTRIGVENGAHFRKQRIRDALERRQAVIAMRKEPRHGQHAFDRRVELAWNWLASVGHGKPQWQEIEEQRGQRGGIARDGTAIRKDLAVEFMLEPLPGLDAQSGEAVEHRHRMRQCDGDCQAVRGIGALLGEARGLAGDLAKERVAERLAAPLQQKRGIFREIQEPGGAYLGEARLARMERPAGNPIRHENPRRGAIHLSAARFEVGEPGETMEFGSPVGVGRGLRENTLRAACHRHARQAKAIAIEIAGNVRIAPQ